MTDLFPGFQAGTYAIDAVHSTVSFSIRHMMVAKVRGSFTDFEGSIVLAEDPNGSSVQASLDPASIDTRNADRDAHLRSGDFFSTEEFPKWTFSSTAVRVHGADVAIDGVLQIKGVEQNVTLNVEYGGTGADAYGQTRVGATVRTKIKRADFGISFNQTLETGGVMLGDDVDVEIEISAVKQ